MGIAAPNIKRVLPSYLPIVDCPYCEEQAGNYQTFFHNPTIDLTGVPKLVVSGEMGTSGGVGKEARLQLKLDDTEIETWSTANVDVWFINSTSIAAGYRNIVDFKMAFRCDTGGAIAFLKFFKCYRTNSALL
jgi:hypothetical protein